MPFTSRQARFCQEYLIDANATQAAVRAGFSAKTANRIASRLLSNVDVRAEIERLQAERAERTKITQDKVIRQFWAIATADPNELIEHRRICCRHCHGLGHGYQRTDREMATDRAAHKKAVAAFKPGEGKAHPGPFDKAGGPGYDERRGPNPDCPVCFGDGVGKVVAKDTRHLSPEARRLYAGVKVTKDGLEVKVHDQIAALVNVGKLQGYFTEKVELTGPGGRPVVTEILIEHHVPADEPPPAPAPEQAPPDGDGGGEAGGPDAPGPDEGLEVH